MHICADFYLFLFCSSFPVSNEVVICAMLSIRCTYNLHIPTYIELAMKSAMQYFVLMHAL